MNEINGYKKWEKTPNTVSPLGTLFTKYFDIDVPNSFTHRLVRVYLPSTYDFKDESNRFEVLYMLDGKNLFDDYTSFVGEWGIDESIEKMIALGESKGVIVVGIDAPNTDIDRTLEMTIEGVVKSKYFAYPNFEGYAYKLADFIFNIVKKDIDSTFFTLSDKKNTGVGGSSMGGLMSFYLGLTHSKEIGYCLNFSPAFFLLSFSSLIGFTDSHLSSDLPRMIFYVGDVGFESVFVKSTNRMHEYLLSKGYDSFYLYDKSKEHNESAWREYFPIAFKLK